MPRLGTALSNGLLVEPRQIAAGTDALVPGSASMLAADVEAGRLVILNCSSPRIRTHYAITTLRGSTPSPAALAFIKMLRNVEAEVTGSEACADPTVAPSRISISARGGRVLLL